MPQKHSHGVTLVFEREKKSVQQYQHLTKSQVPHQVCIENHLAENQVVNFTQFRSFKPAALSQGMTDVQVGEAESMTSNDLCGSAEGSGKSGGFQGYRDTATEKV